MIDEIQISNIRVFDGPSDWDFPLSPLTVFCGTNSAGKSTILKSLLLLCQSHSVSDDEDSGRLRFSGSLVDLGSYQSFVSHNQVTKDIAIGITTRDSISTRTVAAMERPFRAVSHEPREIGPHNFQDYVMRSRFSCGLVSSSDESDAQMTLAPDVLPKNIARSPSSQAFLKEATFDFKSANLAFSWKVMLRSEKREKQQGRSYDMVIPADYFEAMNGFAVMDVAREENGRYVRIEAFLRGLLPIGLWAKPAARTSSREVAEESYFPVPALFRECYGDLTRELAGVHYLGPLRSPAKRYYMTNLDSTPSLDAAGDFLPYVLRDQRERKIAYMPPKMGAKVVRAPLRHALDSWMYYLRTGEYPEPDVVDMNEIDVTSLKDVLLEFTLKSFGGEAHALADSGFGFSQILPIVVRGLIAPAGSTIIVEQPELHLNPALQVRLAEFLASLAVLNRRVLIETHSEHIVNTIRVLAAEDPTDRLAKNCCVFFLDTELETPRIRKLEIQADGTVPEWPRLFFGEALSLSARLLRAQARTRGIDSPKKSNR